MKTILTPTDFSSNAYSALFYATQLFASEKCEFIIVHSFENQVSNLTSRIDIGKTEAVVDELYSTYEIKCEEVKHEIVLDTNNENHNFKTIATSLSLSRAINKLISKEQVDFVVMGSTGSTGARDIFMGSTTQAMIQKIKKAPLLVIPKEFDFKPIGKIAFATGFRRGFGENELEPLLKIASVNKVGIEVIHVYKKEKMTEDQQTNSRQLFELLKEAKPEHKGLSIKTDLYDAITSYLNKEQIELLAMLYYKHNALVRLFRDATVKGIAKYTRIPFLILPAKD